MSNRRGRGQPRARRQEKPIPDEVSVPTPSSESDNDLIQEMTEMRGMLTGLMRVVDTLVTNQARQPASTPGSKRQ